MKRCEEDAFDPVVDRVESLLAWLVDVSGEGISDHARIDRIAVLERVKGAAAAAQARVTTAFGDSQMAAAPAGTPAKVILRSVGSQVALARHESPGVGDARVESALALTRRLPRTMAALAAGEISEEAATAVCRVVAPVDPHVAGRVDELLAPDLGRLGARALAHCARRAVAVIDADAAADRAREAVRSRRVTLRSAPDGMAYLTVLAPMVEATGAFNAIGAEAGKLLGVPPSRSGRGVFWLEQASPGSEPVSNARPAGSVAGLGHTRSQMMADLVIARLTGRAVGEPVPLEVHLVMTDKALADAAADRVGKRGDTAMHARPGPLSDAPAGATKVAPARVVGAGWLPARTARELVLRTAEMVSRVTVRRLVVGADGRTVLAMERRRRGLWDGTTRALDGPPAGEDTSSRTPRGLISTPVASATQQRLFRGVLRRLVVVRDQRCRTPWCGAAIRAIDHVEPHRRDGPTAADNAAGTCERCNYTKEAPGWRVTVVGPESGSRPPDAVPATTGDGHGLADWERQLAPLIHDAQEVSGSGGAASRISDGHQIRFVTPTGHA